MVMSPGIITSVSVAAVGGPAGSVTSPCNSFDAWASCNHAFSEISHTHDTNGISSISSYDEVNCEAADTDDTLFYSKWVASVTEDSHPHLYIGTNFSSAGWVPSVNA